MASIRFGAGIVDARGSISGQTFSRNASGAYIRARVKGTNPSTPAQGSVRAIFAAISTAWKVLTSIQRQTWIDAAMGVLGAYTNKLGEVGHYTGQQLYMKLNSVVALFEGTALDSAPAPGEVPGVTVGSTAGTVTDGALATLATTLALPFGVSAADVLVYASPPSSAGLSRPRSAQYRLISALSAQGAGALDLQTAYAAVYGTDAAVGEVIWLRVVPAIAATGQTGVEVHTSAILTASE